MLTRRVVRASQRVLARPEPTRAIAPSAPVTAPAALALRAAACARCCGPRSTSGAAGVQCVACAAASSIAPRALRRCACRASSSRRWASSDASLRQRYGALLASGELDADAAQQAAVDRLAEMSDLLEAEVARPFVRRRAPQADESGGGWGFFGSKPAAPPPPPDPLYGLDGVRGLYVWGGVGCGKTMLMDLFYECAPEGLPKRRVHFNAFMLEVHQRVHDTVLRRSGAAVADQSVVGGFDGATARGLGGVTPEQADAAMSFYHARTQLKNEESKHSESAEDDVVTVASDIAAESKLLCFDELQVTDSKIVMLSRFALAVRLANPKSIIISVADAMVIRRMLGELLASGCILIATSNRPPEDLYKGGLNRESFLPAIAMIQQACVVHCMNDVADGSSTDYRRMTSASDLEMFHSPLSEGATRELDAAFMTLSGGHGEGSGAVSEDVTLEVMMGRTLTIAAARDGVARMDFEQLCGGNLGAADYLALVENYHSLVLDGVPQFTRESMNELRRFITLVDLLYERSCRLVASAEVPMAEIFGRMSAANMATVEAEMQAEKDVEGEVGLTL